MVAFLKTGVISVVLQSSGTVLLLNEELMIKVILIAGAVLSLSLIHISEPTRRA